jgi:hypothetical protein
MTLQQSSLFFNITVLYVCPQLVSWHVEEENKINKCSIPVRGVKGLLGLSPLGLISPLLKGQVKPLYIMRGDVSI